MSRSRHNPAARRRRQEGALARRGEDVLYWNSGDAVAEVRIKKKSDKAIEYCARKADLAEVEVATLTTRVRTRT